MRHLFRMIGTVLFCWLYLPHLLLYVCLPKRREYINSDLRANSSKGIAKWPLCIQLLYRLHTDGYFRVVFYYRIGPNVSLFFSWIRPGNKTFIIKPKCKIGKGLVFHHPYCTALGADTIGDNFTCLHCTTIGKEHGRRPRIGNNVRVSCNAVIVGDITVGDNVVVAAGSVVVKDVPSNVVVAGVPSKVVKQLA